METNKKILGKINTQRCSVTLIYSKASLFPFYNDDVIGNTLGKFCDLIGPPGNALYQAQRNHSAALIIPFQIEIAACQRQVILIFRTAK
jgi:hypothetical protein